MVHSNMFNLGCYRAAVKKLSFFLVRETQRARCEAQAYAVQKSLEQSTMDRLMRMMYADPRVSEALVEDLNKLTLAKASLLRKQGRGWLEKCLKIPESRACHRFSKIYMLNYS